MNCTRIMTTIISLQTHRVVIEKILKKSKEAKTVLRDKIEMPRELVILRKILPHPNIITLLYWTKIRPEEWMVAFEFHGYDSIGLKSNLKDYLNDVATSRGTNGLKEDESKRIMRQLLLACSHLESYGIYHRNLKLDSIVIGIDGTVKLIDFSLAVETKENEQHIEKVGSIVPPEMYGHVTYRLSTAQIWVLETIFYQLFERIEPFRKERVICKALGPVMFSKYNRPSKECVELMEWMLDVDPNRRPQCIDDVLDREWIRHD